MVQETLRLFIAIELSKSLRDAIHALMEKLKVADSHASIRWVSYSDLHLTLKFLGEVPRENIASVEEAMKAAAEDKKAFELSLSATGVFPNEQRPGVFWVGVKDDSQSLTELAKSVIKECSSRGFSEETRPFSPHITVGRSRERADVKELTKIASILKYANLRNESQIIDHIVLMWSQLTPRGPIYTPLSVSTLN